MNLFTSDLFTPVMSEGLASTALRDFRSAGFGRRYGRATPATQATPVRLAPCVIEAIGDECVRRDYDLAA